MVTWNFTATGTYYITTSWSGTSDYAGADSETLAVFVGPDSFVQFNSTEYNYIFGQASFANYEISTLEGDNDFLIIPLGTVLSVSYDFTILQTGQTVSNVQTETITIPGSNQTLIKHGTPIGTVSTATETEIIPINVPPDLEPLMLPADFDQTINNQFCFIFQDNSGNCSLNANALNDDEMASIIQGNESNIAFMNASENVKENVWYNVTESMSDNEITANLYNTNGNLIQSTVTPYNATASNEMIMFIANNVDNSVIFKDLTVEALNNASSSAVSNQKSTDESRLLLYVSLSILLVATFSVALAYVKKKRRMRPKNGVMRIPDLNMTVNQINP